MITDKIPCQFTSDLKMVLNPSKLTPNAGPGFLVAFLQTLVNLFSETLSLERKISLNVEKLRLLSLDEKMDIL